MTFLDALRTRRLLAIVRGGDPAAAQRTVMTLAQEGATLIEVSLTTPQALEVISQARAGLDGGAMVGAGTVITAQDAVRAADAGAEFVVSPGIVPGLRAAKERGLPLLAGALTPSEVVQASLAGAEAVKLFPASLGAPPGAPQPGVRYLRALLDPFPGTAFVPVGGVDADAARQYLAAGAVAVGVGSPLIGDAASGGSLSELRRRTRQFLAAITAPERP